MSEKNPQTDFKRRQVEINRLSDTLADLYDRRPDGDLHLSAAPAADDGLLFVAVLGGKEVGKTTLINGLAGQEIARDHEPFRGTCEIVAYHHETVGDACRDRLAGCGSVTYRSHDSEPLGRLVLLDMPDFDSDFLEHFDIVQHTLPRLDRIVWLVSHEKYANQSLFLLLRRCAQNPENFLFVLNKLDVVAEAYGPEEPDRLTHDFAAKLAHGLNLPDGMLHDRVFGISAACKTFDFPRLAERILAPVDQNDVDRTRIGNRAHALKLDLNTLRASYPLAEDVTELEAVAQTLTERADGLAEHWTATAVEILTRSPGLADEWTRQVYRLRIAAWPIISLPFGAVLLLLAKLFGLRSLVTGEPSDEDPRSIAKQILHGTAEPPIDALTQCWHAVRAVRPDLPTRLHAARPYPWEPTACADRIDEIQNDLADHIAHQADAMLAHVRARTGRFAALRWFCLILPLLWFPLVQPILESVLRAGAEPESLFSWVHLGYTVLLLLGATHWLKSIAVVAAVYALYALLVYARAKRTARAHFRRRLLRTLNPMFKEKLQDALRGPVDARINALRRARDQLDAIAAAG